MGGNSSKLSQDQLNEVKRLLQQWANEQDNETNRAMRSQYNRVTELMDNVSQRMNNRQNTIEERLARQVTELQEQLRKIEKKMESRDEAGPSGNRIHELLNEIQNFVGSNANKKDVQNSDSCPEKKIHQPNMNFSGPSAPQNPYGGFGPSAPLHYNHGGFPYGYQGYQNPHTPNVINTPGPPVNTHYNPFQNYPPQPNPYQPGPSQYHPPPAQNPSDSKNRYNKSNIKLKNENSKPEPSTKKFSKITDEKFAKSANQFQNLTMPDVTNISKGKKGTQNVNDPNIDKITKKFKETLAENKNILQSKKPIDLKAVEKIVEQLVQQHIDKPKEKSSTEKQDFNKNTKRHDKTESNDRRNQYKSRGQGRSSQQVWRNKNRQARKKTSSRNFDDDLDSDSNESICSNFSSVSKASTVPVNKSKKVYWTNRPNYARDFNFARAKSQIEEATKNLNLGNYKKESKTNEEVSDSDSLLTERKDTSIREETKIEKDKSESKSSDMNENIQEKKENKVEKNFDENQNSERTQENSDVRVLNYPTEQEAINRGIDLQRPLERRVLFIGSTGLDEHTHKPECLADIYRLEKVYKRFKLISLF